MALIECSECGQMVSENAKSCPKCGNPIKSNKGFGWKKPILSIVALVLILGCVYAAWQLIGSNGKDKDIEITDAFSKSVRRYVVIKNFHEGFAAVANKDGKWGYINSKGEEVIPCKYESAFEFSEGLACVYVSKDNQSVEFIDERGNVVIKGYFGYGYYAPLGFVNGKCFVFDKDENELWIDKEGKKVDEPQIVDEDYESDGTVKFEVDDKVGVKDSLGNVLVSAKYSFVDNFSQGLAVAQLLCGDKVIYGYVDKKGNDTFTDEDFAELERYEKKVAEEKRQEEERKRREGVEKIVSITIERDNNYGRVIDMSGNYGAKMYSGMWKYSNYAITNLIRIPNGKVWIFKRTKVSESGIWGLGLFYYAKERGHSGVDSFDEVYALPGNPPVLRAGDGFRIAAESLFYGVATVEVFFSEKDEEYYY